MGGFEGGGRRHLHCRKLSCSGDERRKQVVAGYCRAGSLQNRLSYEGPNRGFPYGSLPGRRSFR